MTLNPTRLYLDYARYRETLTNPRHRALISNAMNHYKLEMLGRVDELLATISPDAVYHTYGTELAQYLVIKGHDEIRALYNGMQEAGSGLIEGWTHDITLSDRAVGVRGGWCHVTSGKDAAGVPPRLADQLDDPEAKYLVTYNAAWFFPFDTSDPPLLLGEETFMDDFSTTVRKLPADEVILELGDVTEDTFSLALKEAGLSE
jgi:hypothetical protein